LGIIVGLIDKERKKNTPW